MNQDNLQALKKTIAKEPSMKPRVRYAVLLVVSSCSLAALLSLWLTEPGQLPLRTQIAFGGLSLLLCGWIVFSFWVLKKKRVLYAADRVVASWIAVAGTGLFFLISLGVGYTLGLQIAMTMGVVSSVMLVGAALMLKNALQIREKLLEQLKQA